MPKFSYVARDNVGKIYKGSIEVENEAGVRAKLKDTGLYTTEIKKETEELFKIKWDRISVDDIVIFTERLSAMINAGLPIIRCLNTIGKQTENEALKRIIYKICLDIEGGERLSDSLAKHPRIFSNFYVNMIRTGETGGLLDEVLQRIAEYLYKEQTLKRNIRKAFAYPVIVLCAAAVVVSFLVIFIVPVFADVYSKMRITLPMPTVMLVAISKIVGHYWWAILVALGLVVFGYRSAYASDKGRLAIDQFKLNFPIFGTLNRKVAISRFIRTFGSLVASGVVIMEALNVVREITGNTVIANIIDNLQNNVREGKKIAEPLLEEKLFPPMVVQMIAAGEEAGALDTMLKKSADFLDRDIDYAVGKLVARLEPLLTVFLAIIVGFIALAIYLPMFDLIAGIAKG